MHKHRDIFRKFLGERLTYADIGRACGVGPATAWRWDNPHSNNGRQNEPKGIPHHHFPAIVKLAKQHGIDGVTLAVLHSE